MSLLLMAKDVLVLKIQDGKCEVLCEELLPFSIRKRNVSLEDFYGNWISARAIQLSRTNSKMILNAGRVPQSNAYSICKACNGLSYSDMYWFKEDGSDISWKDINLFDNESSLTVQIKGKKTKMANFIASFATECYEDGEDLILFFIKLE